MKALFVALTSGWVITNWWGLLTREEENAESESLVFAEDTDGSIYPCSLPVFELILSQVMDVPWGEKPSSVPLPSLAM